MNELKSVSILKDLSLLFDFKDGQFIISEKDFWGILKTYMEVKSAIKDKAESI